MSKSVSYAVSTREPYIIPRATGPRGDIGRRLIWHVIQILTCNVHYIIYFNHAFDNTCIYRYSLYFYLNRVTFPFKFIIFLISFICIQIVIFVSFGPILLFIYIHNNLLVIKSDRQLTIGVNFEVNVKKRGR